jgi:hypothetical protein
MGLSLTEAAALSLYDYEELLWNWNEAHETSSGVAPPDPEKWNLVRDRLNSDPRFVN